MSNKLPVWQCYDHTNIFSIMLFKVMFFLLRSATQKIRRWLGDLNSLLMIARWKISEALTCCSCAQRLSNLMNFCCPQFNFQTQSISLHSIHGFTAQWSHKPKLPVNSLILLKSEWKQMCRWNNAGLRHLRLKKISLIGSSSAPYELQRNDCISDREASP